MSISLGFAVLMLAASIARYPGGRGIVFVKFDVPFTVSKRPCTFEIIIWRAENTTGYGPSQLSRS